MEPRRNRSVALLGLQVDPEGIIWQTGGKDTKPKVDQGDDE